MELLGERPAWSMGGGELLSTLDTVDAEIARLESYRLGVVATIESSGYAAELGARDTAELLRFRYRLDASTARRTLRLVQALSKYPAVSAALERTAASPDALGHADDLGAVDEPDAMDAGDEADAVAEADAVDAGAWLLRPAQADAIVSALKRVPAHVPIDERDAAERELVKLAAHMSPGELRQAGNQMRDILDTDGPEPEELKAYDRESLTLTPAYRGVKFRGYLANENAELLRTLIHAGARPHKTVDGDPDPRLRDKRQADALTATLGIAAAALESGQTTARPSSRAGQSADHPSSGAGQSADRPSSEAGQSADRLSSGAGLMGEAAVGAVPGLGAKAQLTVTIDFEDLKAATADADGQLVYGDGLSAATVRRLACDAKIIPLVLGSNSEPLDVGRSERLVTRAIRRALNARDRGCVICGAPPIMCDAHHLVSWIDGGETKVSNLVLLCRRHDIDLHHGNWTVSITNGAVHVTRPTWTDPPPTSQRRYRRRAHPPVGPSPATHRPTSCPTASDAARDPASDPARDPVGGSVSGSVAPSTLRSRWRADAAILQEAAAFASAGPAAG